MLCRILIVFSCLIAMTLAVGCQSTHIDEQLPPIRNFRAQAIPNAQPGDIGGVL